MNLMLYLRIRRIQTKNTEYKNERLRLLENVKKCYDGRGMIINPFKIEVFPFYRDSEDRKFKDNGDNDIRDNNGLVDYEKLNRPINLKERDINDKLVRKHFQVQNLGALLEKLKKSKNNAERNDIQVSSIKNGLRDFKEETEDMSREEKEVKKPNEIVNIVELIFEFNWQQEGQGLKILTLNQVLSRLPTSLDHLKAGNNSEKLKNEIRQQFFV